MTGKYIVLEGGEYVGKSTQSVFLADTLRAQLVREPGGTVLGEQLRGILLHPHVEKEPATEVLLHAAQRSELARTVIRPALTSGRNVVSDRSWISSAAYQGALGVPYEDIRAINSFALGELIRPDACIMLDADPSVVIKRGYDSRRDYYESKGMEFHQLLREKFLEVAVQVGAVVINAMQPLDDVTHQINEAVFTAING
jgi:dTMP kinase